jgi:Flp pilus assembly protein CpaB
MKNKRIAAAVGVAAVVGAGFLIAQQMRKASAPEQDQATVTDGVVNPDAAKAGMTIEALPQLSQKKFEPPASSIVGSYTEPAAQKDSPKQDSGK